MKRAVITKRDDGKVINLTKRRNIDQHEKGSYHKKGCADTDGPYQELVAHQNITHGSHMEDMEWFSSK
jgi:hypothetical protein